MLKGYEVEKDRYVVLDPGELKELRPRTSAEVGIEQFVRMEEVDPLFLDVSYFLQPDGVEKPYALLYRALAISGYAALGSLAMHGREHPALIRAGTRGLILHTLFHINEVRLEEEHPAAVNLAEQKELDLATKLVEALAAPFEPAKLTDRFEARLKELIESRTPANLAGDAEPPPRRQGVDLLESLRRSLEAAKKPPARQPAAQPAKKRRKA
jgi:DNA end-binding protein Ku